jgi:hypothetical protein
MRRTVTVLATSALVCALGVPTASADPQTGRLRTIDCGTAGVLTVELGPAEFLSTTAAAIHVVDSTAVLVPQRVTVVDVAGTFVTLLKNAINGPGEKVSCSYTDPAGRFVTIDGKITPAS